MSFGLKSVWVALALASVAVQASNNIYVGGGVGAAHFNGLSNINGGNYDATDDAVAVNLFTGYQFNEHFAAELGYQYAGRGNTEGTRYENQGATFSSIARAPLTETLALFIEGGAYWAHTDGLGSTDTEISPLAGAGMSFKVNDKWDLQARYRYMWHVAQLPAGADQYNANQSVATLEAIYHPFRGRDIKPVPTQTPVVQEVSTPATEMVEKHFTLSSDVLFDFGKYHLKPEGVAALNSLYQQIRDFQPKDGQAMVVGYTDQIGSKERNLVLSEARARTVADFLIGKGIVANKVAIEGRADAAPVTGNKCAGIQPRAELIMCLAPDRRVEIRVFGTQEVQAQE